MARDARSVVVVPTRRRLIVGIGDRGAYLVARLGPRSRLERIRSLDFVRAGHGDLLIVVACPADGALEPTVPPLVAAREAGATIVAVLWPFHTAGWEADEMRRASVQVERLQAHAHTVVSVLPGRWPGSTCQRVRDVVRAVADAIPLGSPLLFEHHQRVPDSAGPRRVRRRRHGLAHRPRPRGARLSLRRAAPLPDAGPRPDNGSAGSRRGAGGPRRRGRRAVAHRAGPVPVERNRRGARGRRGPARGSRDHRGREGADDARVRGGPVHGPGHPCSALPARAEAGARVLATGQGRSGDSRRRCRSLNRTSTPGRHQHQRPARIDPPGGLLRRPVEVAEPIHAGFVEDPAQPGDVVRRPQCPPEIQERHRALPEAAGSAGV